MLKDKFLIVMAEDDEGHAKLIQRNLKRAGIVNDIMHVKDGQEALDFIRCVGAYAGRSTKEPLLVLLDINMPRVDGVEVLRQLKADAATAKVPVIMLTTTDDPREVARCYALNCNVYVTKPIEYEPFVDAIQRLGLFLQIVQAPTDASGKTNIWLVEKAEPS
jgi:CheY-like chemotaxis protein